jgi:uncharacterized membrane protein (UPF0127 family)
MATNMKRIRTQFTRRRVFLFSLALGLAATGMDVPRVGNPASAREMEFPRSRLIIETAMGRFEFTVEVADTWARRAQGLQHRRTLAADAGMLFDYAESRPVAMWMKNTVVPLDMLFIDARGRVARVAENTEPLSLTPIPSGESVRAVLELNAGTARRLGIRMGDRVHHPIFDAPAN